MLETPHVIVGAAIAFKIANPAIAIPLAFGSHFILDKVPHWNPHLSTETKNFGKPKPISTKIVIADTVLAIISGCYIASLVLPDTLHAITILLSSFSAVLPDVIEAPYFFFKLRTKIIKKWINFQRSIQEDAKVIPGLATQFITILATFWWIFGE